jgi:hypothetical protein
MCTLSVFKHDNNTLTITMNRDERHERDELGTLHTTPQHCHPVDPPSNGTWIATNAFGLTFALLNRYQDLHKTEGQKSRGQVILNLLHTKTLDEAQQFITSTSFDNTNPFDLIIIDTNRIVTASWNALKLSLSTQDTTQPFFITSSSIKTNDIIARRHALFGKFVTQHTHTPQTILQGLHLQRGAQSDEAAILMNRPHTHTKSLTQIILMHNASKMHYWTSATLEAHRTSPTPPATWQEKAITGALKHEKSA